MLNLRLDETCDDVCRWWKNYEYNNIRKKISFNFNSIALLRGSIRSCLKFFGLNNPTKTNIKTLKFNSTWANKTKENRATQGDTNYILIIVYCVKTPAKFSTILLIEFQVCLLTIWWQNTVISGISNVSVVANASATANNRETTHSTTTFGWTCWIAFTVSLIRGTCGFYSSEINQNLNK